PYSSSLPLHFALPIWLRRGSLLAHSRLERRVHLDESVVHLVPDLVSVLRRDGSGLHQLLREQLANRRVLLDPFVHQRLRVRGLRSEEHTSELQSREKI